MASQGPLGAGTGSQSSNPGGTGITWSNVSNITASDDVRATANLSASGTTDYIIGSNFGFSIPAGATINGIVVEWEVQDSGGGASSIFVEQIKIMKNGVIGSTDKSAYEAFNKGSDTIKTYGGSSDLWGETWNYSDINASNFGCVLSCFAFIAATHTANVDYVRITVYYTAAAAGMVHTRRGKRNYLRM